MDLREPIFAGQIVSLHAGKIDLGIVRPPLSKAPDITMRTIEVERFIAVLPRQHRLAASQSLRLEDLAEDPFMIFPPDKSPSRHAKSLMACEEAGFSPRIALEGWQMAGMVSLIAAGMGVVLLPAQVRSSPHPLPHASWCRISRLKPPESTTLASKKSYGPFVEFLA